MRLPVPLRDALHAKPPVMQGAIVKCLRRLRENPRHPSLHTKKMQGVPGVFESRAGRGDRVTWEWHGGVIVVRNHCNHDILKNP
jgi:mRNA interferase RelE/StbE